MKKYLLLTGATGFIGQYVLERLLKQQVPVVIIARGSSEQSANDRIMAIVKGLEERSGQELPKPICFTGDLTKEDLGLDDFALDWFTENCGRVLHNAASIRFHCNGDREKDPWLSNFTGTQNVVDLCRQSAITEFHHVSTAYVCGNRRDTVFESDLIHDTGYANDYQESKNETEQFLRAQDFLTSKTFYRPALVVGDSRDGYTSAPDFGLYHYMQFNWQIIKQLREAGAEGYIDLPFRLQLTGNERRNIVTVDWIADAILHILLRPELHNETYHLTPQVSVTSREVVEGFGKYFNYGGIDFIGDKEVDTSDQTDFERMFYDYTSTFEAYWDDEPVFDRSNTDRALGEALPTPPIDAECMHRLIDYPVQNVYEVSQSKEPTG